MTVLDDMISLFDMDDTLLDNDRSAAAQRCMPHP